ncbi:MAG: winged helix-turn-helix transcriptional regulator [Thaumarchaeota archaeon]|nr:winged helix-turn-helix transcriptional regulator [Nitrososphaerota archaeon]MDE1831397.1 winged helix-turn-helix transcriptional regulator [Nitrososphaerota archaeon]MDE1840298.1 winged helix-turn-helix transcriptional regulator [Nitrososphaerota archaeon]MDE1876899.1 winged helix-turn-helix transcriptional regulator [Nitrososphaerota archaeon]
MSDAFLTAVDKIDRRIIELLMENARIPARQIAIKLRNEGHDIQDRAVAYRIERLEKKQIIKGYETILRQSLVEDFEALYLRFKASKSSDIITDQICNFVKDLPNCLLTATVSGNWNLLILTAKDEHGKKCERQIIEKFCDHIEDYRVCNLKFESINTLNMQSVMI